MAAKSPWFVLELTLVSCIPTVIVRTWIVLEGRRYVQQAPHPRQLIALLAAKTETSARARGYSCGTHLHARERTCCHLQHSAELNRANGRDTSCIRPYAASALTRICPSAKLATLCYTVKIDAEQGPMTVQTLSYFLSPRLTQPLQQHITFCKEWQELTTKAKQT